jgi:hypothetical protein
MSRVNRRDFAGATLGALGASVLGESASAEPGPHAPLPSVRWGQHEISRVLVGHNPLKGQSHYSAELSREMRDWFAADQTRGLQLLRRCEQLGINTCQVGNQSMEALLRAHYAQGGRLKWISTFYSMPGRSEGKEELARILRMDPKPIGIQQFGNNSDRLMREGRIDTVLENLKMFRDAGVLVGLGSHNHEAIDYAEEKGWDVDFYQCSFYRSWFGLDRTQNIRGEVFAEEGRQAMANTIRQASKPCIAFKVLGANRHCATPAQVEQALRVALESIKPTDVILLGMWQKHKDQVAENVAFVRQWATAHEPRGLSPR